MGFVNKALYKFGVIGEDWEASKNLKAEKKDQNERVLSRTNIAVFSVVVVLFYKLNLLPF